MNNIMLDLETLGTNSNAVIVSIGAINFDPFTGALGEEFYQVVDIADSSNFGKIDLSTIKWWMQQSDEARQVFEEGKASLKNSLSLFSSWIKGTCDDYPIVWGNGATFDNVIISNAYDAVGLKRPWAFYNDRDVRTIVDLGLKVSNVDYRSTIKRNGTTHNALSDAKFQALYLSEFYKDLATNKGKMK